MTTHDEQHGPDRIEPFWWGLFAAGGGLTALCLPAHILFQELLGSSGLPVTTANHQHTQRLLMRPLVRLYLFTLTALSFLHWAHRFRYYLRDFGLTGFHRLTANLCYGSACLGTMAAARTLLHRHQES